MSATQFSVSRRLFVCVTPVDGTPAGICFDQIFFSVDAAAFGSCDNSDSNSEPISQRAQLLEPLA